ncbi:MAG TPA: lipopolysaccharide assembly protein LapB [Caldimonas sp.]
MDFELAWLLWALPLAFALGWVASRIDVRQFRRDQKEPKAYHKGLNFLLNEEHDKAIDAFIEAVQQDPDTSDLHFALGNLFRRRGEYERAVRVHQHLLGRADLPKDERVRAQHALAQDYMKAGLFDRAEDAYKALAGSAFDTESRLALLDLHERAREWQSAIEVARQLEGSGTGSFASRIAHYWCELALEADAAHQTEAADAAIAEAREVAPRDARPLLLAGERAAARGDHVEALRLWNTLMSVQPASFNLVARRYAASARAAGKIGSALERLRSLYEKAPTIDLLETMAALESDAEARQGLLLSHLREHPTMAAAQSLLASRTASAPGADGTPPATAALPAEDATALRQAVRRAAKPLHRYRCAACGFEAEHYFWQCPGCLGWDTYPPRRLEDL